MVGLITALIYVGIAIIGALTGIAFIAGLRSF